MPTTSHPLAFVATAVVLVLIPGPSVLFTVGRALAIGPRGALLTVLGNAVGMFVQVFAAGTAREWFAGSPAGSSG